MNPRPSCPCEDEERQREEQSTKCRPVQPGLGRGFSPIPSRRFGVQVLLMEVGDEAEDAADEHDTEVSSVCEQEGIDTQLHRTRLSVIEPVPAEDESDRGQAEEQTRPGEADPGGKSRDDRLSQEELCVELRF